MKLYLIITYIFIRKLKHTEKSFFSGAPKTFRIKTGFTDFFLLRIIFRIYYKFENDQQLR